MSGMVDTPSEERAVHFAKPRPGGKHNSLGSRPAHRPSLYLQEYCEVVERLAREKGYSPAQLATELNVSKQSLYQWASVHPQFADSLARAKTFEQAHWESIGRGALPRKHFQAQVWRTSMAARFKDEYTEGRSVEVTVSLGDLVARSLTPPAKEVVAEVVTLDDKQQG